MAELKAQFEEAAAAAQTLPNRPSDDQLLKMYALYKQATVGDVTGSRPSLFDLKGAAKYGAWEELKGTSSEQAMSDYIALVDTLKNG